MSLKTIVIDYCFIWIDSSCVTLHCINFPLNGDFSVGVLQNELWTSTGFHPIILQNTAAPNWKWHFWSLNRLAQRRTYLPKFQRNSRLLPGIDRSEEDDHQWNDLFCVGFVSVFARLWRCRSNPLSMTRSLGKTSPLWIDAAWPTTNERSTVVYRLFVPVVLPTGIDDRAREVFVYKISFPQSPRGGRRHFTNSFASFHQWFEPSLSETHGSALRTAGRTKHRQMCNNTNQRPYILFLRLFLL